MTNVNDVNVMDAGKAIDGSPRASQLVANGEDLSKMRTNQLLRRDEWRRIDEEVQQVSDQRLNLIGDLRDRGIVDEIDIGVILASYEQASDLSDASVTMTGETQADEDQQEFTLVDFPVPFIHKAGGWSARKVRASRRRGQPINIDWATRATRKVIEKAEDLAFNGSSVTIGGSSVPGLTTESNRNTVSGSDWGTTSNIIPNINSATQTLASNGYDGPYGIYVSNTQYGEMKALISNTSDRVLSAVLEDPDIEFVKKSGRLTDEAVVVQLDRDVMDLQLAEDVQTTDWDSLSGRSMFVNTFMVGIVRVKSDAAGNSGVAHITGI